MRPSSSGGSSDVGVCWNSNDVDLKGAGLAANEMVKDRFDKPSIRELNVGNYPYADLMKRFMDMDYEGWIPLEPRTNPRQSRSTDRAAATL